LVTYAKTNEKQENNMNKKNACKLLIFSANVIFCIFSAFQPFLYNVFLSGAQSKTVSIYKSDICGFLLSKNGNKLVTYLSLSLFFALFWYKKSDCQPHG